VSLDLCILLEKAVGIIVALILYDFVLIYIIHENITKYFKEKTYG